MISTETTIDEFIPRYQILKIAIGRITGQVQPIAGLDHPSGMNRQRFGQRPVGNDFLPFGKILGESLIDIRDVCRVEGEFFPTAAPKALVIEYQEPP